jgi:hypothetical protein
MCAIASKNDDEMPAFQGVRVRRRVVEKNVELQTQGSYFSRTYSSGLAEMLT